MMRVRQHGLLLGALLATSALVGCAGSGKNQVIERADAAVGALRNDPAVQAYAATDLDRTEQAYQRLVAARADGASSSQIDHLAYLVEQRAAATWFKARAGSDLAEIDTLGQRRNEILLEAERRAAGEAQQRAAIAAQEAAGAQAAAQQAEQRAASLQSELADLNGRQTERGLVLTLGDVLFEVDGTALQPGGQQQIARIAQAVQAEGGRPIVVEGHTDSTGSAAYNLDLSNRRAEAVRQALIAAGVPAEQIQARGLGQSYPVATNDSSAGRQQNRRVEIIVENQAG
jgi:outer membrane protein OmpA-like peptidoglycan-associated protein